MNYLDRFCLLRFLHKANNMNTQHRIKKIMARSTADIMAIFSVKEYDAAITSFSKLRLMVSVILYKIFVTSLVFIIYYSWKHNLVYPAKSISI